MTVKLDLIYKAEGGKETICPDIVLTPSTMIEITVNKTTKEMGKDYLVSIPAEGVDPQLLATLALSSDHALGIMHHRNGQVKVFCKPGQEMGNLFLEKEEIGIDVPEAMNFFPLSKAYTDPASQEFEEKDVYFTRLGFYENQRPLGELSLVVKEFLLDEEHLYYHEILNEYKIIERLSGEPGGLYTVFKAEHKQVQGISLVIKAPSKYAISRKSRYEEVLERMKKNMEFLSHPSIPPILQIVEKEADGGRQIAFIVMKYIEAQTLTHALKLDKIQKKPFPLSEILKIMGSLAEVLQYLHQNGIIHRGISPSNILINREAGSFHLVGFGYSKLFWDIYDLSEEKNNYNSIAPNSLRNRMPSRALDFMPPEFFVSPEGFDVQGDIYSFGAVFYKMLFTFGPYIYYILHDNLGHEDRFKTYCTYMRSQTAPPTVLDTIKFLEEDLKTGKFPGKAKFFGRVLSNLREMDGNCLYLASEIIARCLSLDKRNRYESMTELRQQLELLSIQNRYQELQKHPASPDQPKAPKPDIQIISSAYLQRQIQEQSKIKARGEENEKNRKIKELEARSRESENRLKEREAKNDELEKRLRSSESEMAALKDKIEGQNARERDLIELQRREFESLKERASFLEEELKKAQGKIGILSGEEIVLDKKYSLVESPNILEDLERELGAGRSPKIPGTHGVYYTLEKEIKTGGMGRIYKAISSENQQKVALKLLYIPEEETSRYVVERYLRFLMEMYVVLQFDEDDRDHYDRYVMKGLDYVQHKYMACLVAEFIEGDTVGDLIQGNRNRPLPLPVARTIVSGVARGLAYLYARGFVHRDIKVSNILVSTAWENETLVVNQVKLVDFGLALPLDFGIGHITRRDEIIGSMDIMAPERIEKEVWDIRSDIYSLGIVYYQMITGRSPFYGTPPEILAAHLRGRIEPPDKLNARIGRQERDVVMKMLQRKPEKRYPDPFELIEELDTLK